jgi:cell division protein FtsN
MMWIVVGVVALIVLVALFMTMNKKDDMALVNENQSTQTGTEELPPKSDQTSAVEHTSDASVNSKPDATSISYADALVKYKDRRLQFSTTTGVCAVSKPNSVTYKDNTGIMLDNRSAQSLTIKVGDTYTVKPYGFKIVTLPDIYLKAKTLLVDCNKQQNVATVLVQE